MHPFFARRIAAAAATIATIIAIPAVGQAQQAPATPVVVTPAFDFSGVLFGNYSVRTDSAARANLGGKSPNQFSLDRAYLTFRMPAGENAAIRVTTDIFQNTNTTANGFYQGWVMRLKYAYAQYTGARNDFGSGSSLTGRIGVLHTVIIDYQEAYWPRYLSQVATERDGFFSSADAGIAGLITLGDRWGEVYGTVTSGPGYSAYERDRFKDFALRFSLTPFANQAKLDPIVRSFSVTPWIYKGFLGSAFQSGGAGQIGPGNNGAITDALTRDRWGLFAGVRDRRITGGLEVAQRTDGSETGLNTAAAPRVVHDSTGRLVDGFVVARPFEWFNPATHSGFTVIGRYDHFTPNADPDNVAYDETTPAYNYWVLAAAYDLTQRLTFALDWQVQSPTGFPAGTGINVRPTPRQSTIFMHWQATF
jgi:hypothetical protein